MPGTDITQKNRSEMKFYSTLLLTEGKRWEETQNTCPKSLSCFFACDIHANLNNTHFSSPWLNNSVYLFRSRTIGAHPISPPYSFYFITTITFLILSNLERYMHNCYISCDRYSSKLFQSGNTSPRIEQYPARINIKTAY